MSIIARAAIVVLALSASACATAPLPNSGFLSSYEGLVEREGTIRAGIRERADAERLDEVQLIYLEPAAFYPEGRVGVDLSQEERAAILNEVDRQFCYAFSTRYSLSPTPRPDAARVRVAVTGVEATGRAASTVSAAANWFIPGPISLRPGGLGGLAGEAEMVMRDDQLAAVTWTRRANAVGMDSPSLSRIGDALQFTRPFGSDAARALTAETRDEAALPDPDPCERFGPRFRPLGFVAGVLSPVYAPELTGAGSAPTERDDD